MRRYLVASASLAAFLSGTPAFAQAISSGEAGHAGPSKGDRTTVYDAGFFAQYAPRTALDIVQRVPGFQPEIGATQPNGGTVDVRGFAGAAGNVVINGARPSSKAESLQDTLSRIPAERIVRVELGPGDLFGSDYAGKSQVLNVMLSEQSGVVGTVTASAKRLYTGYFNTDISASAVIQHGASSVTLSAGTGRNRQLEEGTDDLTVPDTGELIEHRRKHNSYFTRDPFLSASWALERSSEDAIRLNARWQPSSFDLFQSNRVTPQGGAQHDDNLIQRYRDPVLEFGGDVTRPLAGGALKLVALVTRRERDDTDSYVLRNGLLTDNAPIVGGFEQAIRARRNETIGRLSWTRSNLAGFFVELGAEGALNSLDDHVELQTVDESGNRLPVDLPIANASVNEKRGEIYVNIGKALSPALRIDGGVNYEFSHLRVRGDAIADRTLKFLKPNLTIDWKPGGGWHTQFSIKRTVAQLDFYDFISVGDLSANRVNGGNADLRPQRAWQFRATAERPIFGTGLFKLDLGYDLISKLQDRILIFDERGHGFDAPGNLGTGKRYFAALTVDAPLDHLWKGLRAKFNGMLQRTRVDDPISGKPRNFSGFFPNWQWDLNVRRDSGPFSYGFDLKDNGRFTFFRTDELEADFYRGPLMTAFVEYRLNARTSISLSADNLLSTHAARDRSLFLPNRSDRELTLHEFRDRNLHRSFGITLKQSFGGGGVAKPQQGG